jgi:hypothetical protein
MEYSIKCDRCGLPVEHTCNANFKEALLRLLTWVPEGGVTTSNAIKEAMQEEDKKQGDEGNFEEHPFFGSQAWSYLLFYKEEARTFHALLHNVMREAGISPHKLEQEAYQIHKARLDEAEESRWRRRLAVVRRSEHEVIVCTKCCKTTYLVNDKFGACDNPECRANEEK